MLALTRRVGDRIKIGDGIEIVVISIKGGQVRLGIQAPKGVAIVRPDIESDIAFAPVPVLHVPED